MSSRATGRYIVLLSGTSGSGKSTLACILANQLGLATVLSTDTIRHILRSVYSKDDHPLLFTSTYESGDLVTNEDLSQSRYRKIIHQFCHSSCDPGGDAYDGSCNDSVTNMFQRYSRCVEGYLVQSEVLFKRLEFVISQLLLVAGESLIVEGNETANQTASQSLCFQGFTLL